MASTFSPSRASISARADPAQRAPMITTSYFLNCGAPIPLRFTPYGLRPITAPFTAGASNQIVSMWRNPASSSQTEYSAGV